MKLSDHYFKVQQHFHYKHEPNPEEGRKWLIVSIKNKEEPQHRLRLTHKHPTSFSVDYMEEDFFSEN